MHKFNVRKALKNILISFNIFCLGGITYYVFSGDFESAKTLQILAIFLWLHYVTGDIVKKISD